MLFRVDLAIPPNDASRLAWWREARFGMFIHWGPVSLKGTEIGMINKTKTAGTPYGRGR
jgi:alpha-L-fucosidase